MDKKRLIVLSIVLAMLLSGCNLAAKNVVKVSEREEYEFKVPTEIYCDHKGSKPEMLNNIYGDRYEVCIFEDDSQCIQWQYFMRDCLPGDNPPVEVNLYFINPDFNLSQDECGEVYPVDFYVGRYQNWEKLTFDKLIEGPEQKYIDMGYTSLINPDVEINQFELEDGVLQVDFSKDIKKNIKTDCQKKILRDQLEWTMEQFGSINMLKFTVDGEYDDFLEIEEKDNPETELEVDIK